MKIWKILRILAGLAILTVLIRSDEFIIMLGIKERTENLAKISETPEVPYMQTGGLKAFGQVMFVSYEVGLATSMETNTVPAVPVSDQILFAESHPAYAQIRFLGFPADNAYQLPVLPVENNVPQIMVFQTKDFAGYGDDNSQGFVNQFQSLTKLLKTGINPAQCDKPLEDYESALPFLPWINMKQSFCSQPQIIEFTGGRGIRYVTYYAQSPEPVLERGVFYAFQGVTNDGQFYISALFPVETGIFPTESSPCPKCSDSNYNPFPEWNELLIKQLSELNAQQESDFVPSLTTLDEVIKSIYFKPQGKS